MTDYGGLSCGTCRHIYQQPSDPLKLNERTYCCRQSPPSMTLLPVNNGAAQMQMVGYPLVGPTFAACSKHEAKPIQLATV